jgi:hypothetical protein
MMKGGAEALRPEIDAPAFRMTAGKGGRPGMDVVGAPLAALQQPSGMKMGAYIIEAYASVE